MPEDSSIIQEIWEPWSKVEIVTPTKYKGAIFNLLNLMKALKLCGGLNYLKLFQKILILLFQVKYL